MKTSYEKRSFFLQKKPIFLLNKKKYLIECYAKYLPRRIDGKKDVTSAVESFFKDDKVVQFFWDVKKGQKKFPWQTCDTVLKSWVEKQEEFKDCSVLEFIKNLIKSRENKNRENKNRKGGVLVLNNLKKMYNLLIGEDTESTKKQQSSAVPSPRRALVRKEPVKLDTVFQEFQKWKTKHQSSASSEEKRDFVIKFCKKYKTLASDRNHDIRNPAFDRFFASPKCVDVFLSAEDRADLYINLGIPSRYARACEKPGNENLTVFSFLSKPENYFPDNTKGKKISKNVREKCNDFKKALTPFSELKAFKDQGLLNAPEEQKKFLNALCRHYKTLAGRPEHNQLKPLYEVFFENAQVRDVFLRLKKEEGLKYCMIVADCFAIAKKSNPDLTVEGFFKDKENSLSPVKDMKNEKIIAQAFNLLKNALNSNTIPLQQNSAAR